jgi:hypothetical protein
MDDTEFAEQRAVLLESIEKDRQEVRVALRELTGAAGQKFDISERIRSSPWAWTIGALLVGACLGSRTNGNHAAEQGRTR